MNDPHSSFLNDIDPDENLLDQFSSSDLINSCSYYTVDGYQLLLNEGLSHNFSLLNFNIRSFHANFNHFESLLTSLSFKYSFINLTETWNTDNLLNLCYMDGYVGHHTYRTSSRGGGVSIFCDDVFKSTKIDSLCWVNATIESCVVRVEVGCDTIFIVGIYRPHTDSVENFVSMVEGILSSDLLRNHLVLLTGDINVDLTDLNSNSTNNYINSLNSMHFLPIIDKPTRFSPANINQALTTLDHIWSKEVRY